MKYRKYLKQRLQEDYPDMVFSVRKQGRNDKVRFKSRIPLANPQEWIDQINTKCTDIKKEWIALTGNVAKVEEQGTVSPGRGVAGAVADRSALPQDASKSDLEGNGMAMSGQSVLAMFHALGGRKSLNLILWGSATMVG
jgi:hypothetical protein